MIGATGITLDLANINTLTQLTVPYGHSLFQDLTFVIIIPKILFRLLMATVMRLEKVGRLKEGH